MKKTACHERTLRVDVTDEDIAKGVRGSPTRCAVARAIRRAGIRDVRVDGWIVLRVDGQQVVFDFLSEITEFIRAWDSAKPVSPFRFRIELGRFSGIVLEGPRAFKGRRHDA